MCLFFIPVLFGSSFGSFGHLVAEKVKTMIKYQIISYVSFLHSCMVGVIFWVLWSLCGLNLEGAGKECV